MGGPHSPKDVSPWRCRFDIHSTSRYGFPSSSAGKESAYNAGDLGSIPGLGKIPWRRSWQPIPVFLPGESPWTEEPGGLPSTGSKRVGHS